MIVISPFHWVKMNWGAPAYPAALLALSAAFSFVIMMFNLPIPGGSTGHAVGGAIIGTFKDDSMFQNLTARLSAIGSRVLRPEIA